MAQIRENWLLLLLRLLSSFLQPHPSILSIMSCSLIRLTRSCTFRNLHPTTNRSISTSSKRLLATPTNSNSTNLSSQSSQQSDPQLGDYPSVKRENLQLRKWSPRWWDPQEKRNFGETVSTTQEGDVITFSILIRKVIDTLHPLSLSLS